ncbi:Rv1355c family protein [Algoriphagus sp. AK58]|uniref:Rv1355c family protein n=1 Tax=Algoriphagus sp. AK58 TaxID=1406877 RepID=UPI001650AC6C|nr:Rv1355c family protein [Algoriphagus sp. AK58]MBC6368980.1 hypothetical protein [Algoriphagus sp. AK58]
MIISEKFDLKDQILPLILDPNNSSDWDFISELKSNPQIRVNDEIFSQVEDLIKSNHPDIQLTKFQLHEKVVEFFHTKDQNKYGCWVYYPWKYTLVHLLPEKDFVRVRTLRNNYKITPSEQEELSRKKVGIVGLSVGQSVALAMALERSCGEMRLADFDTLELSNLNRLKAGVTSLGLEKLVIAAREISEIDPFIKLTLFKDGVNSQNIDAFLEEGGKLDLLIDECDSFDIKILLRQKAKEYHIPVMMDTSDRGMLDVERFDLERERQIFHGYLGEVDLNTLKNLSNTQKIAFGLKITGLDTLSPRMKASLLEVGQTITSWPQLASAVFLGGASVAHVGRKLLLGEPVKSGRYYVDFDELIPVDSEEFKVEIPSTAQGEDFVVVPNNVMPSGYLPTNEELFQLVEAANLAPSGGNMQPWIWVFDKKGILHLFHDQVRSHSLLDYRGTGSLIAFGAALENLRLKTAQMGIETEEVPQIKEFGDRLIASIRFVSKVNHPLSVPFSNLVNGLGLRCTNRKNSKRQLLTPDQLSSIYSLLEGSGLHLKHIDEDQKLEKLAAIIGGMDRMRLFHHQGLVDFIKEVRWSDKEARETRDGIDISTLELSGAERAAMGLLKDPRTVKFFRKFLMGYGLTKISRDTITTSSAMFLLGASTYDPQSFLEAGKGLQRIWIWANQNGLSFQPVTASLFIFHLVLKEKDHGFTPEEEKTIKQLKESLDFLFDDKKKREEIFMFRLNFADGPSMRAYRREVADTLKFLD